MARNNTVEGWNEWSDESLPTPIGKGKVKVLRVIGSDKRINRLRLLSNEEYTSDPKTGNQFMIGPIERPGKPDKKTGVVEPVLYDLWLSPAKQKTWTLVGGRKEDEAIWAYLQKSNQFAGYEHRDDSHPAVIELIDLDAPLKESIAKRNKDRAAQSFVDSLSDTEVKSHFGRTKQHIDLLRERLILQALKNPKQFEKSIDENVNMDLKACVIDAEKAGIIVFNKEASAWNMDDEELFSFKKGMPGQKGGGKHNKFVEYINNKNPELFDELLKRLS